MLPGRHGQLAFLKTHLLSVTKKIRRTAQIAVAAATSNPAMLAEPKPAAASRLHATSMAA
jgi:hypothetical protein